MVRRALLLFLAFGLLAPAAAQRLPQLDGRPLWHQPLSDAPAEVRRAIERHREARAARLRRAPTTATAHAGWSREVMQPWLTQTRDALQEIERTLLTSDGPPTWRLLGLLLSADLHEHLATSLLALPAPEAVAADPEMLEVYTSALRSHADPLLEHAASAFEACDPMAAATPPPFDVWSSRCRERAQAIRTSLASRPPPAAPAPPLRGAESMPPVCATPTPRNVDEVPAPDPAALEAAPPEIVVSYVGTRVRGAANVRALESAVERTLARRGSNLVPAADVRRARAMVAQRRWQPRGPVCALPPSLVALLAPAHPNLVVARVDDSCTISGCRLTVDFHRPWRVQTVDSTPLPPRLEASIERPDPRRADWIAAARALTPRLVGVLGMLSADAATSNVFMGESAQLGGLGGPLGGLYLPPWPRVTVAGVTPNDPRLAPAARLHASERELHACFVGRGVVAFHVRVELDASGAVSRSQVDLVEGTATGSDRALQNLRSCVQRVIAATPFPCPGEAASFEAHLCIDGSRESRGAGGLGTRTR